jgi:phage shock protein PspC (stress-responsive transcriptional regulator)/phosphatidylglycerophosphate synthase
MKKTFSINLGGRLINIDEDAYEVLHKYLDALKQRFSNETERNEIVHDIESRFAELFLAAIQGIKDAVGVAEVNAAIAQMGSPEDIAGEEQAPDKGKKTEDTEQKRQEVYNVPKKLYRDGDGKVIGGVISGMAYYFGLGDPIWLRLAALALVFFGVGSPVLIYIVLWAIIPEAVTTAQKLQMRGEPVNISNIEREVREAVGRVSEWGKKQTVADKVLHIGATLVLGFLKIISVIAIIFCIMGLTVIMATFLGVFTISSLPDIREYGSLLTDSHTQLLTAQVGLFLLVAVPLLAIIFSAFKFLSGNTKGLRPIGVILFLLFAVGVAITAYNGIWMGNEFSTTATKKVRIPVSNVGNTLYVQLPDSVSEHSDDSDYYVNYRGLGNFSVNGHDIRTENGYMVEMPNIELMVSDNDSFYIEEVINSQGPNKKGAFRYAGAVNYSFSQADSVITLAPFIEIAKGSKWRGQSMKLRIAVPEGREVRFSKNIDVLTAEVKGDDSYDDTYFANTTWTVKDKQVKLISEARTIHDRYDVHEDYEGDEVVVNETTTRIGDTIKQVSVKIRKK